MIGEQLLVAGWGGARMGGGRGWERTGEVLKETVTEVTRRIYSEGLSGEG